MGNPDIIVFLVRMDFMRGNREPNLSCLSLRNSVRTTGVDSATSAVVTVVKITIGYRSQSRPRRTIDCRCLNEFGVSDSVIASPTVRHPNVVVQTHQLV